MSGTYLPLRWGKPSDIAAGQQHLVQADLVRDAGKDGAPSKDDLELMRQGRKGRLVDQVPTDETKCAAGRAFAAVLYDEDVFVKLSLRQLSPAELMRIESWAEQLADTARLRRTDVEEMLNSRVIHEHSESDLSERLNDHYQQSAGEVS